MSNRQGCQPGAPMGDWGEIWFDNDVAARIADSGAAWVRLNFRLGPKVQDWTESSTLGFSALSRYELIVGNAMRNNLKVLGLICNEAWQSSIAPTAWRANSAEAARGSGDNAYLHDLISNAASLLFDHFSESIEQWQIWNEPNSSATMLYPSNFAWLLRRSYEAARASRAPGLKIVSGGILSTHSMASKALTSSNTGADYLRDTYKQGKLSADWDGVRERLGSYPLDIVGQHLYIDQWGRTSPERFEQATGFMAAACAVGEGTTQSKPIHITELGWTTDCVSEATQAENLKIAFLKLKSMPGTPMSYWFFLRDEPSAKLAHGLLRSDGSEKPAWSALKEINAVEVYPKPQAAPRSRLASLRRAIGVA